MASIGPGITLGAGITLSPVYTVVTDGLVVSLDANEFSSNPGAGDTWTNQVAGPTFTLPNGATYSSSNGGILTFDRASTQSAHGTSVGSALTTFTAETWVKFNTLDLTSGNATCTITEVYGTTPINYTIACGMLGNPALWQGGYFDGGAWHLAGTLVPVVDTWYCMTVTYDGTDIKFYVNGEINDTVASAVTPGYSNLGIHVGERWDHPEIPQSFLDGSVPVVRLYDRALSSAEILQNFNANQSRFGL